MSKCEFCETRPRLYSIVAIDEREPSAMFKEIGKVEIAERPIKKEVFLEVVQNFCPVCGRKL